MAFKILLTVAALIGLMGVYFMTWQTKNVYGLEVTIRRPNAAWLCWFMALALVGIGWLTSG